MACKSDSIRTSSVRVCIRCLHQRRWQKKHTPGYVLLFHDVCVLLIDLCSLNVDTFSCWRDMAKLLDTFVIRGTHTHTHNRFTALWNLSGTRVKIIYCSMCTSVPDLPCTLLLFFTVLWMPHLALWYSVFWLHWHNYIRLAWSTFFDL